MHALPSGLRTTTPRIDGMRARFPRFPHPPPPLRRCLWEGWEGRPRPHPPAAPGPSHSERARARFPRFPQDPTAIPAALRPTDPRHNAPPPPAGGGENQNRPQTRRVCGIAASQTSPVLPPCILMESPPGETLMIGPPAHPAGHESAVPGWCTSRPHATMQSDAQARERRPLGSSPGGARHSPPKAGGGKDPQFGGRPSRPRPPRSASSGRLGGTRLSLRFAQRCRRSAFLAAGTIWTGGVRAWGCIFTAKVVRQSRWHGGASSPQVSRSRAMPTRGRCSKPSPPFCSMGVTQFGAQSALLGFPRGAAFSQRLAGGPLVPRLRY